MYIARLGNVDCKRIKDEECGCGMQASTTSDD